MFFFRKMELKASTIIALLASCLVLVQSYALPASSSDDEVTLSLTYFFLIETQPISFVLLLHLYLNKEIYVFLDAIKNEAKDVFI